MLKADQIDNLASDLGHATRSIGLPCGFVPEKIFMNLGFQFSAKMKAESRFQASRKKPALPENARELARHVAMFR